MPNSPLIPNANVAIKPRTAPLHPSVPKKLRFLRLSFPPRDRDFILLPVQLFIGIPTPPLHIIDKNAYSFDLQLLGQPTPIERDVRGIRRHDCSHIRRFSAPPRSAAITPAAFAELGGRLDDGGEAPTSDTVDEEAEKQALVDEAGPRLESRTWHEQEREDVMVYSESQAWEGKQYKQ